MVGVGGLGGVPVEGDGSRVCAASSDDIPAIDCATGNECYGDATGTWCREGVLRVASCFDIMGILEVVCVFHDILSVVRKMP